jgi:glutamine phosphoribosylpyrophosphate amidotransferase
MWTALPDIGDRAARGTTRNRPSAVATAGITARYGARTFISPVVALAGVTNIKKNRAN